MVINHYIMVSHNLPGPELSSTSLHQISRRLWLLWLIRIHDDLIQVLLLVVLS